MLERLSIYDATRAFGPEVGIFGLDLTVAEGEVHAVIGLNGAGKTTLMRTVLGMLHLSSGTITINGTPLPKVPADTWSQVGHLVEHPFAYPELDTRTNLEMAARLNGAEPASIPDMVDTAITALSLDRYARVMARRLSQGNLNRLGLAAALQHDPSLIVLDEPTNALDPAGIIDLREMLLHRAQAGAGVLVSSLHLDEVARFAHRISVLNRGQLIGSLTPGTPDLEREFFQLVHADDKERQS